MEFPAGKTLGLVYRHQHYGEPDWLHEAQESVLLDASNKQLDPLTIRRDFIEFVNGFRVVFLDEDRQETESRGYRFDELHCIAGATRIDEIVARACYTPR